MFALFIINVYATLSSNFFGNAPSEIRMSAIGRSAFGGNTYATPLKWLGTVTSAVCRPPTAAKPQKHINCGEKEFPVADECLASIIVCYSSFLLGKLCG